MRHLLDANLPLRWADRGSALRPAAIQAIRAIYGRDDELILPPQSVIEFWGVATPPVNVNGLGMTPRQAGRLIERLERFCTILLDPPDIFSRWRRLVTIHEVSGKKVHDARLAAFMLGHGIDHILTFTLNDFARYPGIVAIDPRDVAG